MIRQLVLILTSCWEKKMRNEKYGIVSLEVKNFLSDQKTKLVIKKHPNRNEYLKVENIWVRNFAKKHVDPKDLNTLYDASDIKDLVENEIINNKLNHPNIANEATTFSKMIIVSDGYNFSEHADIFKIMPEDTCLVTVNQALKLWNASIFPNYYLVLNTGENAMPLFPDRLYPRLIASRRIYHDFLTYYKNVIYFYDPVPDTYYQSQMAKESLLLVDDYRNPICACIGLANYFKVDKLYLAFCSHAFKEYRDGTIKLGDGLYQYPQQRLADQVVDGNLFWLNATKPNMQIYHTGIKNSFMFSRYLSKDLFQKALYL